MSKSARWAPIQVALNRKRGVMEQEVKKGDKAVVISGKGRADISAVSDFKSEVKKLLGEGDKNFVIDMGEVVFVDSSFLGALVACLRSANKEGGEIKIANLLPHMRSIFELTRLHRLFEICDSVEAAEAGF